MSIAQEKLEQIRAQVQSHLDGRQTAELTAARKAAPESTIRGHLKAHNAVIVAHYYTAPEIQALAEDTGGCVSDSLAMARFGRDHPAETLIVAGVRVMGETAKILTPGKRVLMPTLEATCSLDEGCPIDEFSAFCDAHPDREVVVYANTSAAVKTRADWVVTSSIALDVAEHLAEQDKAIIWAPDRHLGDYVQRESGADVLLWDGACIVHEEFKARGIRDLKQVHPESAVLVHPESPAAVIELADHVGSTTQIIRAACEMPHQTFIVATDQGIFYKLQQAAPDKTFIIAPTAGQGATCRSCANCPWMAMNDLEAMAAVFDRCDNEIEVPEALAAQAMKPLERMLALLEELPAGLRHHDFQAALVRELPAAAVEALAASRGWSLSSSTSRSLWLKRKGLVLQCCWGQFTTLLPAAQVVVSMAGTASEQAVGLGKPVLQLAGHGPQFTVGFAEAQRRLLGPGVHCAEGDVDDPHTLIASAELLKQLLELPEATLKQLRQEGDQRLGQAGGTKRMARAILERLQQR